MFGLETDDTSVNEEGSHMSTEDQERSFVNINKMRKQSDGNIEEKRVKPMSRSQHETNAAADHQQEASNKRSDGNITIEDRRQNLAMKKMGKQSNGSVKMEEKHEVKPPTLHFGKSSEGEQKQGSSKLRKRSDQVGEPNLANSKIMIHHRTPAEEKQELSAHRLRKRSDNNIKTVGGTPESNSARQKSHAEINSGAEGKKLPTVKIIKPRPEDSSVLQEKADPGPNKMKKRPEINTIGKAFGKYVST